jgi:hypothetical protein
MKLNELINETLKDDYYGVTLKDGGGYGVQATSLADAKRKAKARLRVGDVIKSVKRDPSLTAAFDDKKEELVKYVKNHVLLKTLPSIQKGFLRELEKARTGQAVREINAKIEKELKNR